MKRREALEPEGESRQSLGTDGGQGARVAEEAVPPGGGPTVRCTYVIVFM